MSIKKTSIQQAIIEARDIEKFATEKAMKALEEEMAPRIKQVTNEALRELEKESLNEGMNLEIPDGAELTIKVPGEDAQEIENPSDNEEEIEASDDNDTDEEANNEDEEENMSDIFEIEGLNEDDVTPEDQSAAPVDANAAAPVETPAPTDVPAEATTMDTLNQKLDDILAKVEAISSDDNQEDAEGDVSIIEDEPENAPIPDGSATQTPAPDSTPAPAAAPGNMQEDDMLEYELEEGDEEEGVVYEVEDDSDLTEGDWMFEDEEGDDEEMTSESLMKMFEELGELSEIEVVDEDSDMEEETMEEDSQMKRHGVEQRQKIRKGVQLGKHAPRSQAAVNENKEKIKAQYESKTDELKKENESLKQTIKEYKDSFIVLRKQINEIQIFNAKLAYANKLFTNGGITNDEKVKIAEEFDRAETIEEAKKLYNKLLNEMKISKSPKTAAEKLKSASPAVIKPSNAQTLFESDEMRRMKRLAGISKKSEE